MGIFPIRSAHFAAPNLKDPAQNARGILVGNFAQEGKFPSPCNGLFALEGLTFSTGFPDDQAPGVFSRT